MALDLVNAGDELKLTVSFYDEAGALIVPASATYQVTDIETGDVIRPATGMTPIVSTFPLTLTFDDNSMHNTDRDSELHEVKVIAMFGTDVAGDPRQKTEAYRYKVQASP